MSGVGQGTGKRQDEAGEVEVDGGQQDDLGGEVEGSRTQSIDRGEGRADRQEGDGRIGHVPNARSESDGVLEQPNAGRERNGPGQPEPGQRQGRRDETGLGHEAQRQEERGRQHSPHREAGWLRSRRADRQEPQSERHQEQRRDQEERDDDAHTSIPRRRR